jgi:biopolymer transport protein ExbD
MSFIPEDQLRPKLGLNLAPMIDFVFLMLAFFASLTITKVTIKDSGISLVKVGAVQELAKEKKEEIEKVISISISKEGSYKWITEYHELLIKDADQIGLELARQYDIGALPKEKSKTQVLLQIDSQATWSSISQIIFAVRDQGFEVHPIYQPDFAH